MPDRRIYAWAHLDEPMHTPTMTRCFVLGARWRRHVHVIREADIQDVYSPANEFAL